MFATEGAPQRARWAVMFISTKGGKRRVIRKNFGDDFASARDLYDKARDAGKPYATLACVNMGFPPPLELRPRMVNKRGRSKRTRKIITIQVEVNPIKELNLQGKLWCPYCITVRPFVLRKHVLLHGIKVKDPRYVCPICGISSNDHHVRVFNPTASIHMTSSLSSRTRTPKTPTRRRRRSN